MGGARPGVSAPRMPARHEEHGAKPMTITAADAT
jgi:hypothetical protein